MDKEDKDNAEINKKNETLMRIYNHCRADLGLLLESILYATKLIHHLITNCRDGRKIFYDYRKKNPIPFALEQTLSDETINGQIKEQKLLLQNNPLPPSDTAIYLDGKKLSPQEVYFEEYYISKFDEEKWLRENRIEF